MCITLEHHDVVVYMLPVSTKDFDINNDTEARSFKELLLELFR